MAFIERYGEHWERAKMFEVSDEGKMNWADAAWPDDNCAITGARGIYVLYRGSRPIYIGLALKGANPIGDRLHYHTKDEFAPWWDNACWYHFDQDSVEDKVVEAIESLMVAHTPGIWNGTQPAKHFGDECFMEGENRGTNELWRTARASE